MGFRGRYLRPTGPVKRRARFVKGELPDWIEEPGTLMRATARIVKVNGESQIPGYLTMRPISKWDVPIGIVIAKPGDFGLYLGKKHARQKSASGREFSVPVPTFWFNGFRIVFTTLSSYEDAIVSDDVYDDWFSQHRAD
jgi:hypothetical protein